ncbi:unnamed protein product [Schistosoma curassoni]|uniref:ANK_REP_REGION domain-containing protein n=1 Tax=Schistosoma curassoni TaxID=6186 RepID=A0A183K1D6_9TREM|nr:unnamed protein product [Schistosoma curassoni]
MVPYSVGGPQSLSSRLVKMRSIIQNHDIRWQDIRNPIFKIAHIFNNRYLILINRSYLSQGRQFGILSVNSTCLHYSVGHGAWQVVNLILDTGHAHPDHINRSGFSPIMIATLSNITDSSALKTLSRLFSMGDVNLCTNTSARQSPLMLAALHGGVDICSLLIAHGANINAQDASGNTALMYAIEHGHIDVVKCLLGCRDLDLTLVDNNDKNALDVAKSKNDLEILNLIQLAYSVPSKATSSTTEISPGTRYAVERRNTHKLLLDLCDLHQIPIPKPIQ